MNYVARKRCTCLSSTTIFANRIVPGQVHLPRYPRPLCPGVSPAHLNPGERRRPSSDLTSKLVQAEVDGKRLDDEEIVGFVGLLLIAGHITTTATLGNSVIASTTTPPLHLPAAPDSQDRLPMGNTTVKTDVFGPACSPARPGPAGQPGDPCLTPRDERRATINNAQQRAVWRSIRAVTASIERKCPVTSVVDLVSQGCWSSPLAAGPVCVPGRHQPRCASQSRSVVTSTRSHAGAEGPE